VVKNFVPEETMKQQSGKQQPEALARLGEATQDQAQGKEGAPLVANARNAPIPTENETKHDVAEKLLREGAEGEEPDPKTAGEHRLPDRTRFTNE
jgi:hypothetical protein